MDIFGAIILGIVQGATEWLPISSSGHLVIFEQLFKISADIFFNLMLHLATLIAVCFVFRRDILDIIKSVIKRDFKSENGKLFLFLAVGSIPIALAGFFFEGFITSSFSSLTVVGIAMIITGFLIMSTKFAKEKGGLSYGKSLFVGLFQAAALLPGLSRSGATISSSLLSGIEKQKAVRFSFLLSIPAIIGATVFLIIKNPAFSFDTYLLAGMLTAMIVGYLAIKSLIKIVVNRRFYLFSIYCFILGSIVLYLALF